MKKILENRKKKPLVIGLAGITILLVIIGFLINSFALTEPISSISFQSQKLNYETSEPGSWKVEKSAEWISSEKARITFQVDTILKTEEKNTDIILVLDISGSMEGDKLNRVKKDSKGFINALLSNMSNKIALITFDSTSEIISEFTKDKDQLLKKIDGLNTRGGTNYYQALVKVDDLLKTYTKEDSRDLIVLFLTDGYPCLDTPNEIAQYNYLKEEYPYLTIHGIQYEMGNTILEPIKKISDSQFAADIESLNNVLFDASVTPIPYDNFVLTDYIDTDNFYVEDMSDIKVSQGKIEFNEKEQKITWTIDNLKTGSSPSMTIDVKEKEESKNKELLPTNKKESVESKIEIVKENVESNQTPILKGSYQVTYEGNAPSGCNVSNLPEIKSYQVFDTVEIDSNQPICEGYQFKGWKIVTEKVIRVNQDYFTMPEADVILRAEWSNLSISKTMDGEVYEYAPAIMRKVNGSSDSDDIWKYKSNITKVVFQNSIQKIEGAEEFDISEAKNSSVMAYLLPNIEDNTTYTAYIQSDGGVIANQDSSYLLSDFSKLTEIEGMEYLDTSNVANMYDMFGNCYSLQSLDFSHFDTSNVTDMSYMFYQCNSLISLDLSNFNTSQVTNMSNMFSGHYTTPMSLTSLDLSNFDTSKVTNMFKMFYFCHVLTSLEVSGFDTLKVENMSMMFTSCNSLTNLDVNHFDTSNVTDMSNMFDSCSNLTSLDVSHFNTSKVMNMVSMFSNCSGLTNLDVSHFDTSKVMNMSFMFSGCSRLASLDVSHFDTSNVVQMSYMFEDCPNLTSLDVSHFNTSNVTSMSSMFSGCNLLTSLDVSNFDTSKVMNMDSMFKGCSGLASLDLNHFDTSNVTNMAYMFNSCNSLTNLDLSNFDTSKVTKMNYMFSGDIPFFAKPMNLTSLDISNFDTSKVTNMSYMFSNCTKLTTVISITNPNTTNYTNMFKNAATDNAQIIVDYIDSTSDLVDKMIATKSENSNVIKRQNYNAAEIEYSNSSYTTCNNVSCALDELYNIFGGN